MTDEQIKQNAEYCIEGAIGRIKELWAKALPKESADGLKDLLVCTYEKGAHSRDEEIEQLGKSYHDMFVELAYKVEQLRKPWISVEERLPEINQVVLTLGSEQNDEDVRLLYRSDVSGKFACIDYDEVTHWMPIPELQTTK